MTTFMLKELDRLKKSILALSAVVEETVQQSIMALQKLDVPLAEKIIRNDERVDAMEVNFEEDCLKVLALHQPVAGDLRFIISVLKINNDLERIADLATNIAERAVELATEPRIEAPFDFPGMAAKVESMLEMSLDALVNLDDGLAHEVTALDDEVDALHSENHELVKNRLRKSPEDLDGLIKYLSISRYLERIADLATNIAEDVIYLIEGEIIRHTT